MEYLVSRYVDAEEPVAGQRKIDKILSEHYTESAKKKLIKSRIKENGEYTLLGQLTVRLETHGAAWVDLSGMTGRNQDALKKTAAGLLKLLHTHRAPETLAREEITPMVEIAVEMRQRVTDQLAKMLPAEFGSVDYRSTLTQE